MCWPCFSSISIANKGMSFPCDILIFSIRKLPCTTAEHCRYVVSSQDWGGLTHVMYACFKLCGLGEGDQPLHCIPVIAMWVGGGSQHLPHILVIAMWDGGRPLPYISVIAMWVRGGRQHLPYIPVIVMWDGGDPCPISLL